MSTCTHPKQPQTAPKCLRCSSSWTAKLLLWVLSVLGRSVNRKTWSVSPPRSTQPQKRTKHLSIFTRSRTNRYSTTNIDNTHTECNNNPVGYMCTLVDSAHLDPRFYQSLPPSTMNIHVCHLSSRPHMNHTYYICDTTLTYCTKLGRHRAHVCTAETALSTK